MINSISGAHSAFNPLFSAKKVTIDPVHDSTIAVNRLKGIRKGLEINPHVNVYLCQCGNKNGFVFEAKNHEIRNLIEPRVEELINEDMEGAKSFDISDIHLKDADRVKNISLVDKYAKLGLYA